MQASRSYVARILLIALSASLPAGCQASQTMRAETAVAATSPADIAPAAQAYAKALPAVDAGRHVAVLLPLHGKLAGAGLAIQRGMLAAWFRQQAAGLPVPALHFHDTSRSDFNAVYAAALEAGADVVIGPLEKDQLRMLQQRSLPVPTLALNYADDGSPVQQNLYHFGLAGEDEAAQVARRMLADGYRNPAVLVPAEDWGQRIAQQFTDTLRQGGGRGPVMATYQGNGDYGDVVRGMLDVAGSENRHARLQRVLGISLGFRPSHRQDIDSIFIIGNTLQGTQLAPAIRYHHADDLPVFSTSHVNGQPSASAAADLEGVRFIEIPWISRPDQPLRDDIRAAWRDGDEKYTRLYALGADALGLAGHLDDLRRGDRLAGVTGQLSLDAKQAVRRELDWMQFRQRGAVPDATAN